MKKSLILLSVIFCLSIVLTGCSKKKIEALESQLAAAESGLETVTREKKDLDDALKTLTEEKDGKIAELETNLAAVTEEKDGKIAELETNLAAVTEEKDGKIAELETNLAAVTEEKDGKIAELETSLAAVTEEKDGKIAELETNLAAVTEEKDGKIAELDAALDAMTKDKNDKLAAVQAALIDTTAKKDTEIAELEAALEALTKDKNDKLAAAQTTLVETIAEKDGKIAELDAALEAVTKDKNDKIFSVQSALTALTEEKDKLLADAEALLASVREEKDAKIAELDSALTALSEEKDRLLAESESALHMVTKEKNEKVAEAESKLKSVLEEKEKIVSEYEAKISSLVNEREQIAAEFGNIMQFFSPEEGKDDSRAGTLPFSLFSVDEEPEGDQEGSSADAAAAPEAADTDSQENDPAFLGTWYVKELCITTICFDVGDIGVEGQMIFNEDHTVSLITTDVNGKDNEEINQWQIIDGDPVIVYESDEEPSPIHMTVNDELVVKNDKLQLTLIRDIPEIAEVGNVIEQADQDYFLGNWQLTGLLHGSIYFPVEGFGITGSMAVSEDKIDFSLSYVSDIDVQDSPYEFADGVLTFSINGTKVTVTARDNDTLQVNIDIKNEEDIYFLYAKTN